MSGTGTMVPEGNVTANDVLAGLVPGTTGQADWLPGTTGTTGMALGLGTGQAGIVPAMGTLGGTVGAAITDTWDWLQTPFKNPLSFWGLFLIVGAVIVAIILWNLILYHVRIAAETVV